MASHESSLLSLATEEILEVIYQVDDPIDLLSLSTTNKRLAEMIRYPWPWEQILIRDGWNLEPIKRDTSTNGWLGLARAANDRHVVEWNIPLPLQSTVIIPERGVLTPLYMFQLGLYLKRVISVISQIGKSRLKQSSTTQLVRPLAILLDSKCDFYTRSGLSNKLINQHVGSYEGHPLLLNIWVFSSFMYYGE